MANTILHGQLKNPAHEALARKLAAETLCDVRTARKFVTGIWIKGTGVRTRLEQAYALLEARTALPATGT